MYACIYILLAFPSNGIMGSLLLIRIQKVKKLVETVTE